MRALPNGNESSSSGRVRMDPRSPEPVGGDVELLSGHLLRLDVLDEWKALETPVGTDGSSELRDLIADERTASPMDALVGDDLSNTVLSVLSTLRERAAFRGWLFRIATRLCLDTLRGRARWREGKPGAGANKARGAERPRPLNR